MTEHQKLEFNEMLQKSKEVVMWMKNGNVGCAEDVCGMRGVGGRTGKRSEWWHKEVNVAMAEKRFTYCGYKGSIRYLLFLKITCQIMGLSYTMGNMVLSPSPT